MQNVTVKKIAIFNPLEDTLSNHFSMAAARLDIDISDHQPDLALSFHHLAPKKNGCLTYYVFTKPLDSLIHDPLFLKNILSYDGYIIPDYAILNWLGETCYQVNKPLYYIFSPLTLSQQNSIAIDFKKSQLVYQERDIECDSDLTTLKQLSEQGYAKPLSSDFPFTHGGIGLYLPRSTDFLKQSLWEILASGALALSVNEDYAISICDDFELLGNNILYASRNNQKKLDPVKIKETVDWVRNNANQAEEIAKKSHHLFNEQYALEALVTRLITMHNQIMDIYKKPTHQLNRHVPAIFTPNVTYIICVTNPQTIGNAINSVQEQSYQNIKILLLVKEENKSWLQQLNQYRYGNVFIQLYSGQKDNGDIMQFLQTTHSDWVGMLTNDDILFPYHTSLILQNFFNYPHPYKSEAELFVVYSNSTKQESFPLGAACFKLTNTMYQVLFQLDFYRSIQMAFTYSLTPFHWAIFCNTITCTAQDMPEPEVTKTFSIYTHQQPKQHIKAEQETSA